MMLIYYVLRAIAVAAAWVAWVAWADMHLYSDHTSLQTFTLIVLSPLTIPIIWGIWGTSRLPSWIPIRRRPLVRVARQVGLLVTVSSVLAGVWHLIFATNASSQGLVIFVGVFSLLIILWVCLMGMVALVSILALVTAGSYRARLLRSSERTRPLTQPVEYVGIDNPFGSGVAFAADGTVRMFSNGEPEDFRPSDIRTVEWIENPKGYGTVLVWFGSQRREFRSDNPAYEGPRLVHLAEEYS